MAFNASKMDQKSFFPYSRCPRMISKLIKTFHFGSAFQNLINGIHRVVCGVTGRFVIHHELLCPFRGATCKNRHNQCTLIAETFFRWNFFQLEFVFVSLFLRKIKLTVTRQHNKDAELTGAHSFNDWHSSANRVSLFRLSTCTRNLIGSKKRAFSLASTFIFGDFRLCRTRCHVFVQMTLIQSMISYGSRRKPPLRDRNICLDFNFNFEFEAESSRTQHSRFSLPLLPLSTE